MTGERRWRSVRTASRSRVALSIAWFSIGLAGVIAAELAYGWRAAPIEHAWHAAAYVVLGNWLWFVPRLHR